jgi:hypothetical protein
MIDRIFSAALTFALLIGGTLAIGAALFGMDRPQVSSQASASRPKVVQLQNVVVVAKRLTPTEKVAVSDETDAAVRRTW